ncbi:MAG: DUF4249 family protein [Fidelibacterota bacterium]
MKNIFFCMMITVLVLFTGCEELEEVQIRHDPYLNIYANVTAADPDLNYVHVFRTTAYGEPDRYEIDSILYHEFYFPSSGDTITYETLYIDTSYAVNDAKVRFICGGDSIFFIEKTQGVYVPEDTNFHIETGEIYELYVETEDFETATASETALSPVSWYSEDTVVISLSDPSDSLRWENTGAAYRVVFRRHYQTEYYDHNYIFESEEVSENFWKYDTSRYDEIFNPDPFYRQIHGEWSVSDTLELTVSVVTYSASFIDYQSLQQMNMLTGIIRYPAINDFRVNIDNALGAFTSISVSGERTVIFVP